MSAPLVSVLMPVYNGQKYLHASIESILTQSYRNIEFVIVNDGSADSSGEIIKQYAGKDHRIVALETTHGGLVNALNFGMRACSGEYVARMDCDDIAISGRLLMQVRAMESDKGIVALGTSAELVDEFGTTCGRIRMPCNESLICASLTRFFSIIHPTVMFRREFFCDCPYTEGGAEDIRLFGKILMKGGRLANLPQSTLFYRRHKSNTHAVQYDFYNEGVVTHLMDFGSWLAGEELQEQQVRDFRSLSVLQNTCKEATSNFLHCWRLMLAGCKNRSLTTEATAVVDFFAEMAFDVRSTAIRLGDTQSVKMINDEVRQLERSIKRFARDWYRRGRTRISMLWH